MNKSVTDLLRRADNWPVAARNELAEIAGEIELELASGASTATPEELTGIDRGLHDSVDDRFVSDADVEAVFNKHRRS